MIQAKPTRRLLYSNVRDLETTLIMRMPGVGSQYLMGFFDSDGRPFDGAKTYKVTQPKGIPAEVFWSLTLYDNQTRSMLQTPQKYPRASSRSYPSPVAEGAADGITTIYFSPAQPKSVARGNWIQSDPKKSWFTIPRLYSPSPRSSTRAGVRARLRKSSHFNEWIGGGVKHTPPPLQLGSAKENTFGQHSR